MESGLPAVSEVERWPESWAGPGTREARLDGPDALGRDICKKRLRVN